MPVIYRNIAKPRAIPSFPTEAPNPPSQPNLRVMLMRAVELGNVGSSRHFKEQCAQRGFVAPDAEELIETGEIIQGPEYDDDYHSWKCAIWGKVDSKGWKLIVGLDCASDLCKAPVLTLITVHQMGAERAKSRRRG